MKKILFILIPFLICSQIISAGFRAGVARKIITPETPVWLSGYASRNAPATEILQDLWTKALVISKDDKISVIIVTMDVIGLSHELAEEITGRITTRFGIERSQLLINTSHTHSGPVIWPSLSIMFDLSREDIQSLLKNNRMLSDAVVETIDLAYQNMKPVNIFISHGTADFAVNRRQKTEKGVIIGVNKEGPVDHDVPVIKISSPDNKLIAILFGYACHNTTLDINQINGDYAGFAQAEIERSNPGTIAMFLAGCGADQNPYPRRSLEAAIQHGQTLANAVQKVLQGEFKPVRPRVKTNYTICNLEFAPFKSEQFREEILGNDQFRFERGKMILETLDKGFDFKKLSYPVQAIRFGKDFTIIALAGEVVVDYSLKIKEMYSSEDIFVAGYCTEVPCYIPSARILKEGGYEPVTSMVYYGMPGPFSENIENTILEAVSFVLRKTGIKPARK